MSNYYDLINKIEELTQPEFEALFIKLNEKIKEDPIKNFIEAPGFINMELTPGQRVLFKLVMQKKLDDSIQYDCFTEDLDSPEFNLNSIKLTEIELYKRMTGLDYDPNQKNLIRDVSLVLGRRSGKTSSASILAIYNTIKTDWTPMLGKKNVATILVMSHTKEFSDEIIGEVRSLIEASPILSRLVDKSGKNTQSTINLKIPFLNKDGYKVYSKVRIRTNAASSKSSRGSACPVIIADEIGFWSDATDSKESDVEIVKAAKPSMLQFEDQAMWIELSTPNTKRGVLYEKYENRFNLLRHQIMLQAPSWVFNNRYRTSDYYDFWKEDKENFDREFRANFVDSLSSFISPEYVDKCVMRGVKVIAPPERRKGTKFIAAIDAAFRGDVFTITVVGQIDNKISEFVKMGWKGTRQNPVNAHEVAKYIKNLQRDYDFATVYADQFSFNPLREIFSNNGVQLEERTFTMSFKKQIYKNLKYIIESEEIQLLDHQQTIKELKELKVETSPTGAIKILHPPGGHDDFADSLAVATFIMKEQSGVMQSDFNFTGSTKDYSISLDRTTGRAFTAPSPEMLSQQFGSHISDNSDAYTKDPDTGLLKSLDEDEDDDEEVDYCIF